MDLVKDIIQGIVNNKPEDEVNSLLEKLHDDIEQIKDVAKNIAQENNNEKSEDAISPSTVAFAFSQVHLSFQELTKHHRKLVAEN